VEWRSKDSNRPAKLFSSLLYQPSGSTIKYGVNINTYILSVKEKRNEFNFAVGELLLGIDF